MGLDLGANKLEGGFQDSASQHQCLCVRTSSPPASLGGSLRPAGGSDPGSFQITASAVGPGACEIWDVVISSELSISHSCLALLKVSPASFKALCSGASFSRFKTLGLGSLTWG